MLGLLDLLRLGGPADEDSDRVPMFEQLGRVGQDNLPCIPLFTRLLTTMHTFIGHAPCRARNGEGIQTI